MHRGWVVLGLLGVAIFVTVAGLVYPSARSNCASNVFTGNATNPGACRQNETVLGVAISLVGASTCLVLVAVFLGRRARSRSSPLAALRVDASEAPPPPDGIGLTGADTEVEREPKADR